MQFCAIMTHSIFPQISQQTPYNIPMMLEYGVSFVSLNFDLCSDVFTGWTIMFNVYGAAS